MPPQFTPDQIQKLKDLGIQVDEKNISPSSPQPTPEPPQPPSELPPTPENNPNINNNIQHLPKKSNNVVFPLLSISGITLLSFSGIILLKNKTASTPPNNNIDLTNAPSQVTPTQVPKSIQHYLLTSQQLFTQALQLQQSQSPTGTQSTVDLLNQSILAATEAIKEFPNDYRGYQQRGKIYQALITSKPDLINQSISDISTAFKLNPTSSDITHTLASLYAQKGDAQNTILYLTQTINLDPTKAQNFYDLAKIQQQAGFLSQALDTYNRLISLLTDPTQKSQVESEKSAIEKLIAQNPKSGQSPVQTQISPINNIPSSVDSPTIQASTNGGLIIADSQEIDTVKVKNQTESNSLSGNALLSANEKSMTFTNSNVTPSSQIYLTITQGGKNQSLQVISKSDKSFTVGLDTPISEDIQFKWWIIN